MTASADGRGNREPPQAIFDRISRRRAAVSAPAVSAPAASATAAAPASPSRDSLPVAELVDTGPLPGGVSPAPEDVMGETFPRSATMRTLLRHPALAVGVGVPAAVVLLRSSAARRLIQTGLVLGARPEVRAVIVAAAAAAREALEARRLRTRKDIDDHAMPPEPQHPGEPRRT